MRQVCRCAQGHCWRVQVQSAAVTGSLMLRCPECAEGAVDMRWNEEDSARDQPTLPPRNAGPDQDSETTLPPRAQLRPPDPDQTLPPRTSTDEEEALEPADLPDEETSSGPRIAGYDILGELGRGGMGVVYKARHIRLKRTVALKMILAGAHADEEVLARFQREAEAVARLQHRNIVQVFEIGENEGLPFFALEFIEGGSLDRRLAGKPIPAREAARLVHEIARGMHHAHQREIVHRDLKPANVLLCKISEPGGPVDLEVSITPKITDFGLAKQLDVGQGKTRTGVIMGTPSYMAPEQAEGRKDIGPAADIWSVGAILYECLTGRPPFVAETPFDTILQVLSEEAVPPRRLNPRAPRDLETIALKCLQKDVRKRYPTAEELADDLQRWLVGEPIRARRAGVLEKTWKTARKKPSYAILALIFSATVFLGMFDYFRRVNPFDRGDLSALFSPRDTSPPVTPRAGANSSQTTFTPVAFSLDNVPRDSRLVWTPDSSALVVYNSQGQLRVWYPLSGQAPQTITDKGKPIIALAVAPTNQTLAVARNNQGMELWSLNPLKREAPIKGLPTDIRAICFSRDGAMLALADAQGAVHLCSPKTQQILRSLDTRAGSIRLMSLSAESRYLALVGETGLLSVWDVLTGQPLLEAKKPFPGLHILAWSGSGTTLTGGLADGSTVRFDVSGGHLTEPRPTNLLRGSEGTCSEDGKRFARVVEKKELEIWEISTPTQIGKLSLPGVAEQIALNTLGNRVAVQMGDKLMVWILQSSEPPSR